MNRPRTTGNPFDLTKATDFSDEQIVRYWVDLAGEEGLESLFKPTSPMPMLLLGGKGSGKTHLMRYFSSAVQKLRHENSLLAAAQREGHIGIYLRADGLNYWRFAGKGQSEDQWAAVFSFYFELWLAAQVLKTVSECLPSSVESDLVREVLGLFSTKQPDSIVTVQGLVDHLTELRKDVDHVVSNCTLTKTLSPIDICLASGQLAFELPPLIQKYQPEFRDALFVYLIDEIENFTETQQKFLNTLIRYRRGNVSIKIGARLYGIQTKSTLGAGEVIKQDAEYERVELDAWLRDQDKAYAELARNLIINRLEQAQLIAPGNKSGYLLGDKFETLDSTNNYQAVALDLVKKFDARNEERPYLAALRQILTRELDIKNHEEKYRQIDQIVSLLRFPDHPLLEKANIYLLYKDWSGQENLSKLATEIAAQAKQYLEGGKEGSPKYYQMLDHFRSDFLAQLFRDCSRGSGRSVVYAGLDTLIHLSQGVPRNLLTLLKHIFRRSAFAEERPFQTGCRISLASQAEGVRDAAAWFWDDAQPDSHGTEVRAAIESLAELFRGVRFSLKPAECELGTFTVDNRIGTSVARSVLNHAENWSYLIRVRDGAVNRNEGTIDGKYQLSPMLVAKWEVSEYRRGTIQLSEAIFNAIFDPALRSDFDDQLKNRLRGMREPYLNTKQNPSQSFLF